MELAGALAEIARQTLKHDFRTIDPAQSRIVLLEAGPRVLPTFPEELSASAVEQPQRLGVEVRTGAMVTAITPPSTHRPGTGRPSRRAPRCGAPGCRPRRSCAPWASRLTATGG